MQNPNNQTTFATKLGMILATAGCAVGLGNIWRFPTMTGENGGAAFIFIYMIFNVLIGFLGMLAEFIVGKNGGCNPMRAYIKAGEERADGTIRPKGRLWGFFGIMGSLCSSLILGFYSVVAGWCVYYLYLAATDQVLGSSDYITGTFQSLVSKDSLPVCCTITVLFILMTHFIVVRGIQKGIELASKFMVPMLILLLVILGISACSLPGAWEGIEFLFKPDLSKVTWKTVFEALSHSFFSLSLGTACLCTYAAYMQKDTNIPKSAAQIACIDIGVAILAGIMIFPAAFSAGVQPDAGPSLIFLTLPNVFTTAFSHTGGIIISILFYFLLVLAALTSTISMHEIGTSLFEQELHISRAKSGSIVTAFCCIVGVLCTMSFAMPEIGIAGATLFDNCDYITAKFMMPIGAFCTAILVGWVMPRQKVMDQLTAYGKYPMASWLTSTFFFIVRYVCPICISIIFVNQLIS